MRTLNSPAQGASCEIRGRHGAGWSFQPLTEGPAREIVIRMTTRWSRAMAAR